MRRIKQLLDPNVSGSVVGWDVFTFWEGISSLIVHARGILTLCDCFPFQGILNPYKTLPSD